MNYISKIIRSTTFCGWNSLFAQLRVLNLRHPKASIGPYNLRSVVRVGEILRFRST